jgi:uncharacterized protein (DUF302 family)
MRPRHPATGHATRYGYGRSLDLPFATVLERTRRALQDEGFGLLFEVDLRAKLRAELGVEFRNYVVLGACSSQAAHHGLLEEIDLGLLLPCNVVVYEDPDQRSTVKAIDAVQMLAIIGNRKLDTTAAEIDERLHKVIDGLGRQ